MDTKVRQVIHEPKEIDALVFSGMNAWNLKKEEQEEVRERLIRKAFIHHVESCSEYRSYVERKLADTAQDLETLPITQVPLIPTSAFKQNALLSVADDTISKWCLSSGTKGLRSKIPRDKVSLERLTGSLFVGSELLKDYYEHEVEVLNLGPDKHEAGDIWFSYVMSLIETLYPTTCFVQNNVFEIDAVIEELSNLEQDQCDVIISSPPFLLMDLIKQLQARGKKFNFQQRLILITAGGWKVRAGEKVSREDIQEQCKSVFGIELGSQLRDVFNQVELNSVIFECTESVKHIPPWVDAYARSPLDLTALPDGEEGLMSFLDASANSYPCFYVGDDLGKVEYIDCACGISSKTISLKRRIETRDIRGCATSIMKEIS